MPRKRAAEGAPERTDFSRTDWQREKIGRISVRVYATNRKEWNAYHVLLNELYEDGHHPLLRAIKAGAITLPEVRMARRAGRLSMADLENRLILDRPLWETLDKHVAKVARAEKSRQLYRQHFGHLRAAGLPGLGADAAVRALERVDWQALRGQAPYAGKSAAHWNLLGHALSSTVSKILGDRGHEFRRKLYAAFPFEDEFPREISITLDEFVRLMVALREDVRAPVMALAVTGLRLAEYRSRTAQHVRPAIPGVEVLGKGGKPRLVRVDEALWPWVAAAIPARHSATVLRKQLKKAASAIGHPELRVHDLRHLHGVAAALGGANMSAIQQQFGHATLQQTLNYLKHASQREAAQAVARAFAPLLAGEVQPPAPRGASTLRSTARRQA